MFSFNVFFFVRQLFKGGLVYAGLLYAIRILADIINKDRRYIKFMAQFEVCLFWSRVCDCPRRNVNRTRRNVY